MKKPIKLLPLLIVLLLLAMLLPLSAAADEHGVCGDPFTPIL